MVMNRMAALSAAVSVLMMAGNVFGADDTEDPWRFSTTVPLWAAGIDGDVTVRGNTADVGISFDELTDHLDASFALGLEARRKKFGFFGDVGYMKFSADATKKGASGDAELKFLIADAGGFYRLAEVGQKHPFIVEATAGLRFWAFDTSLELTGPGGRLLVDGDTSKNLADPIIGLRGSQFLTPKLHLDFAGDVGGFGISDDSSDLTWSAAGLVSYDFKKWFSLSTGYRALSVEMEEGSGASKKGLDIIMHGLLINARFTF